MLHPQAATLVFQAVHALGWLEYRLAWTIHLEEAQAKGTPLVLLTPASTILGAPSGKPLHRQPFCTRDRTDSSPLANS